MKFLKARGPSIPCTLSVNRPGYRRGTIHRVSIFLTIIATFAACGDCDGGPGTIEKKQGEALAWEDIGLGIEKSTFFKLARKLGQVEGVVDENRACRSQFVMIVPDISEEIMQERSAGEHALLSCLVRGSASAESSAVLEIRGEFIDGHLSRLSFRLKPTEHTALKQNLTSRFGKGAEIVLEEDLMMERNKRPFALWKEKDEVWLLSRGEQDTTLLVHQDLKSSQALPPVAKASTRGKPVSLEDLGIGKLDLNAPMPDIEIPDSGPPANATR
jgi:hypothetical protein